MSKKLEKLKTLIPLHELEQSAQQQIYDALNLDFLIKLAVMPDCHTGYSLPIGGVALLDSVISPEYVGYDIGCGMCHILTDLSTDKVLTTERKISIFDSIYKAIPVGPTSRKESLPYEDFKNASGNRKLFDKVISRLYVQLGTLGGGNHFIEIGKNKDGFVAITIHSGSRNMGHSIASHYMKASRMGDPDLPRGFFHLNGDLGQQYLHDMNFALDYALENRKIMMREVLSLLGFGKHEINYLISECMINETHNHAVVDGNHVLHRKGATPANKGQFGIIPGNMKSGVYVTVGLGNEEFLKSASHGAGRTMSRTKAKATLDIEVFKEQMKGITAKVGASTLDESPGAYKDLHKIIEMQEGIVIDVVDYIEPLINVKG